MYHFKWYMSGNRKIKNGLMEQTNEYDCKKKLMTLWMFFVGLRWQS
jgi:hypothetical protein